MSGVVINRFGVGSLCLVREDCLVMKEDKEAKFDEAGCGKKMKKLNASGCTKNEMKKKINKISMNETSYSNTLNEPNVHVCLFSFSKTIVGAIFLIKS